MPPKSTSSQKYFTLDEQESGASNNPKTPAQQSSPTRKVVVRPCSEQEWDADSDEDRSPDDEFRTQQLQLAKTFTESSRSFMEKSFTVERTTNSTTYIAVMQKVQEIESLLGISTPDTHGLYSSLSRDPSKAFLTKTKIEIPHPKVSHENSKEERDQIIKDSVVNFFKSQFQYQPLLDHIDKLGQQSPSTNPKATSKEPVQDSGCCVIM
jgi:hypothetical protein